MLWALPLFWAWVLWRLGPAPLARIEPRLLLASAGAGLVCYHLGALTNFYALTLIDASLERVLLFTYPALVVLARLAMTRRLPERGLVIAIALTWAGTVLAVGGLDPQTLRTNALGALLVLFCALTLVVYFLINEAVARNVSSMVFTALAMSAAGLGLAGHYTVSPGWGALGAVSPSAWGLLAALVLVATVVPMFMVAEGVRRIGAQRAALVTTVGPPSTILLAWLFLGERMMPAQLAGAALILATIAWLEWPRRRARGALPLPDEGAGGAPVRAGD